jgi:hypothetical protein
MPEKNIFYKVIMHTGQEFKGMAVRTDQVDGVLLITRVDGRELRLLSSAIESLHLEPR